MRSTANHRTGGKRSPAIRPVPPSTRQHSAAWGLALFYACLIVYASLYPFAPWSSNGLPWWGFVSHPWPRYWTGFDITANLLGYMPMGFLVALAALRDRGGRLLPRAAVPLGIFLCALLSFAAESLQNWLPQRVPSNVDWLLNTLGGSLGSLLAWGMGKAGALNAWSRMRQHWFVPDAQEGLVLLLLWPWALLYPLPVPFGLGQVQEKLERWLALWLAGTPFALWMSEYPWEQSHDLLAKQNRARHRCWKRPGSRHCQTAGPCGRKGGTGRHLSRQGRQSCLVLRLMGNIDHVAPFRCGPVCRSDRGLGSSS